MKKIVFFIALAAIVLVQSCDAQNILKISPDSVKTPSVDGVVAKDEYSTTITANGITLSLSRTQDKLYLAITCSTTGWVSIGTGSARMNNARIFMGFVVDNATRFTEQRGSGHDHRDVAQKDWISTSRFAKEANGTTTLEFECPASALISFGQKQLDLIVAFGSSDSFSSMHSMRKGLTVTLE